MIKLTTDYPNGKIWIDGYEYSIRFNGNCYSIHGNKFNEYGYSTDLAAAKGALKAYKKRIKDNLHE